MTKFLLLSTLISIAIGGYYMSLTMGDTEHGGMNVMNAQACTTEVQHGFKAVKKSLQGNQLQIQTLSFCMQAVTEAGADNIDPKHLPRAQQLNKQYYALEGALERAPLEFMVDGKTYRTVNAPAAQ